MNTTASLLCFGIALSLASPSPARADAATRSRIDGCLRQLSMRNVSLAKYRSADKAQRALNRIVIGHNRGVACVNRLPSRIYRPGATELKAAIAANIQTLKRFRAQVNALRGANNRDATRLDGLATKVRALRKKLEAPNITVDQVGQLRAAMDGLRKSMGNTRGTKHSRVFEGVVSLLRIAGKRAEANAHRAAVQVYVDMAVTTRLPSTTKTDAIHLAKVRAAFAASTADQLAYPLAGAEMGKYRASATTRERPLKNARASSKVWQYVGIRPYYFAGPYAAKHSMRAIQPLTPVLIWHVDGNMVTLVSPDGGVYRQPLFARPPGNRRGARAVTLGTGLPPRSKWPKLLQSTRLTQGDLVTFEAEGIVAKGTLDKLRKAAPPIARCTAKVFRRFKRKFRTIELANITSRTRENRYSRLEEKVWKAVSSRCRRKIRSFESIYDRQHKRWVSHRAATGKAVLEHLRSLAK